MTPLENLEAISGSKDRARVILASVRELVRDEQRLTAAAVDARCYVLPGWSECGDDEVTAALAVIEAEGDAHVAKLEAEAAVIEQPTEQPADRGSVPSGTGGGPAEVSAASTDTASQDFGDRDTALARVTESTRALADARSALTMAGDRHRALRAVAATAIEQWQRGLPRTTFRQALMEVSATQRLTKELRQEATAPGPSAWDKRQYYSSGRGHVSAFVEKQMRGGGNHRGALPLNMARGPLDTAGKSKTQLRKTDTGASS